MAHALPQGADDTRAHLHRGRDVPSASPTPIPIVRQRQQPAAAAAAATPDSAVLDRMLELESAIATVKSSLDNHASSYYSVASQIAELNARIGRLGVADRHMAEHHLPSISVDNDYEEPNNSSSEYSRSTADMGPLLSSLSHSMPTQIAAHMDTVKSRITPDAAAPVASDREEGDEHYTRIQEMIDSLIKDAGSALQTTPDCTQSSLLTCSGDSTDMPRSRDPLWSPEQLSSVSTVFDDPLMSSTPVDSLRRAAPKSATGTSFDLPDMPTTPTDRLLLTRRPASAMSMGSRGLRRSKPRPRTPLGKLRPRQDPAEADAESDSDMSSLGALANVHGMRTANSRHRPRSSKQQQQQQQQKQSGHYSDRCAPGSHSHQQWLGRKRSDTVDSIMSNSSETCVSPVTRMSHEFYRTPSNMRASSQLLVDTLCTPTRRHFDFGIDEHEEDKLLPYMPRRQMDMQKTGINAQEKHAFPQLYTDDQLLSGKERQERQVSENNGSIHASNNVPFIRRVRNSVTRAMLRSASFVDDSVNDDIAAYSASPSRFSAENTGVSFGRSRSNTVACDVVDRPLEHAEYVAQSLQTQLQLPRFPSRWESLPSGVGADAGSKLGGHAESIDGSGGGGGAAALPAFLSHSSPLMGTRASQRMLDTANPRTPTITASARINNATASVSADYSIRRPDSIEEVDSDTGGIGAVTKPSEAGHRITKTSSALIIPPTKKASENSNNSVSGLLGIATLLYWTLMFTLGALMLDSFICRVAGKRVMGTVDRIAQNTESDEQKKDKNTRVPVTRRTEVPCSNETNIPSSSSGSSVGRFVRWYIEALDDGDGDIGNNDVLNNGCGLPQERQVNHAVNAGNVSLSLKTPASLSTSMSAPGGLSSLGLSKSDKHRPPPLRVRKPSAMRGSFKHID